MASDWNRPSGVRTNALFCVVAAALAATTFSADMTFPFLLACSLVPVLVVQSCATLFRLRRISGRLRYAAMLVPLTSIGVSMYIAYGFGMFLYSIWSIEVDPTLPEPPRLSGPPPRLAWRTRVRRRPRRSSLRP